MPKMGDAMEEGPSSGGSRARATRSPRATRCRDRDRQGHVFELEAEDAGTLAQLIADEGQDIPVGEAIAFIAGEGEAVPEQASSEAGGAEEAEEAEEGGEGEAGGGEAQAQTATETEAPEEEEEEEEGGGTRAQADGRTDGHFRASPIVRRLAEENDLDLSQIDGWVGRSHCGARRCARRWRAARPRRPTGRLRPRRPRRAQPAEVQGFQPRGSPSRRGARHRAGRADAHDEGHRRARDRVANSTSRTSTPPSR